MGGDAVRERERGTSERRTLHQRVHLAGTKHAPSPLSTPLTKPAHVQGDAGGPLLLILRHGQRFVRHGVGGAQRARREEGGGERE